MQAGLFSTVSAALVLAVQPNLQPDPNQQSAAVLSLVLLALNHSAIPNETLAILSAQQKPPREIVIVSGLMYTSLMISLLAAFVAMLGKQWLNRYLRHAGGSIIERCGDRQLKYDGLRKWQFHLVLEALPVMLQVALLLLACGLWRYMASINTPVAVVLITLTGIGGLFYLVIAVSGALSYACPFQTPASTALRILWKKVVSPISSVIRRFKQAIVYRSQRHGHPQSPTIPLEDIREASHTPPEFHNNNPSIHGTNPSHQNPDPPPQEIGPPSQIPVPDLWLAQGRPTTIEKTNTQDIRCVSWILRSITDPESLDAAIRLAGTIRWFEDRIDLKPPYDIIISTLYTCLDSTGTVYPGLSDRAYYSARAILWIHIRAMCKAERLAYGSLPPPRISKRESYNVGLKSLLGMHDLILCNDTWESILRNIVRDSSFSVSRVFAEDNTPEHMRWASNALLHVCQSQYKAARALDCISHCIQDVAGVVEVPWNDIPLDATLNILLVWSIYLDCPVEEETLKIQDKTYVISHFFPYITHVAIC